MRNEDVVKIERLSSNANTFSIRWQITALCNYACDFCIQGDKATHLKNAAGETEQIRQRICEEVKNLIEGLDKSYTTVKVNLIGGEVTILKDFPNILETLAACRFNGKIVFSITTNLSRSTEFFRELCDIVSRHSTLHAPRTFCINASYYKAYAQQEEFCEKLISIRGRDPKKAGNRYAESLYDLKERLHGRHTLIQAYVPIISDQDYFCFQSMQKTLENYGIKAMPLPIRNYETSVSPEITKKIVEKPKKNIRVTDAQGNALLLPSIQTLGTILDDVEQFCPRGYLCDAGIREITIKPLGDAKRCPALYSSMSMGNILDGTFKPLEKMEICASDHCSCNRYGLICKPDNR